MKAVLVDDEEGSLMVLKSLINKFCPEIEIVALCKDLPSAKKEIDKHSINVVFFRH